MNSALVTCLLHMLTADRPPPSRRFARVGNAAASVALASRSWHIWKPCPRRFNAKPPVVFLFLLPCSPPSPSHSPAQFIVTAPPPPNCSPLQLRLLLANLADPLASPLAAVIAHARCPHRGRAAKTAASHSSWPAISGCSSALSCVVLTSLHHREAHRRNGPQIQGVKNAITEI